MAIFLKVGVRVKFVMSRCYYKKVLEPVIIGDLTLGINSDKNDLLLSKCMRKHNTGQKDFLKSLNLIKIK